MYINIVVKNYKKKNGYSDRGNNSGGRAIAEEIHKLKNIVSKEFKKNNINYKKLNKEYGKDILLRTLHYLETLEPRVISIDDFSHKHIMEPCINICMVQNKKQREKFDIIAGNELGNIIFDRTPNNENYSNGLFFAKKYNKKFFPRFLPNSFLPEIEEYRNTVDTNEGHIPTIGIYLRPDVCPNQSMFLAKAINSIYFDHKISDPEEKHLDRLPKVIIYGSDKLEPLYPKNRIEYTTSQKEFFTKIDTYIYAPMEIPDPMPNTLVEAIYNEKEIIILHDPETEYLDEFGEGIKEIESTLTNFSDLLKSKSAKELNEMIPIYSDTEREDIVYAIKETINLVSFNDFKFTNVTNLDDFAKMITGSPGWKEEGVFSQVERILKSNLIKKLKEVSISMIFVNLFSKYQEKYPFGVEVFKCLNTIASICTSEKVVNKIVEDENIFNKSAYVLACYGAEKTYDAWFKYITKKNQKGEEKWEE